MKPSELSVALGKVERELHAGETNSGNPRGLTPDDLQAKAALRDELKRRIQCMKQRRGRNEVVGVWVAGWIRHRGLVFTW